MVADLVNHHMAHDTVERFAGFTPIGQDRSAIEKDAVDIMAHHATDEKYCEECLSSGFCEADPDYGYNWEPYYG